MKLLSYEWKGKSGIGILDEGLVVPISNVANMIELIEMGDDGKTAVQAALAAREGVISVDKITYLPVVERPGKVIALGRNYAAHAAEGGAAPPKYPMLFHKTHTSLNGAEQPITIPEGTEKVDYEAELAVIIGKKCKNVCETDAMDYVYVYAAANDVTV